MTSPKPGNDPKAHSARWRRLRPWLVRGAAFLIAAFVGGLGLWLWRGGDQRRLDALYSLKGLTRFEIRLDAAARASLGARPREFVKGEFLFDGKAYSTGIALKGHRSMKGLDGKAAFKVDFDRYEEEQTFFGARRLTLNNMVDDPTMMREALAYRFMQALGVTSPRTGYAHLTVNGEEYGVYLIVEAIDDTFFAHTFPGPIGVAYEGEYGCDLVEADVPGFERDAGEDPERRELLALARAAEGDGHALFSADGPLDMPKFLRFLAGSALIGDFDGYRHSHNYRIYRDPGSGKWHFMPWGLDRVFHQHLGIYDSEGRLAKRCFSDRACRLQYVRTLAAALNTFESMRLVDMAKQLHLLLRDHAASDARKPYDATKMNQEKSRLGTFLRERPQRIREQLRCIDADGQELDRDGDGHGCMDCNDADAKVGPHASEVCDGIDNDCSGMVDDAAACECAKVEASGRMYHLCNWPMPWSDASELCRAKGLVLADVESKQASRALYAAAEEISKESWWIGYSDLELEGEFLGPDGAEPTFTFWDKAQPNNLGCNEDCAALREQRKGKWQDMPCHFHRPFICVAPRM